MDIPVIWKSYKKETPNRGYWDQGMLEELFKNKLWNPIREYTFKHFDDFIIAPQYKGAVVIIPARYHYDMINEINKDINELEWCLLIVAGDEEGKFEVEKIKHSNCKIWLMTPHIEKKYTNVDRFIGEGYPPLAPTAFAKHPELASNRHNNWYFSGQVTHKRRRECRDLLRDMDNGLLFQTTGFTKGLPQEEYYRNMVDSKVVPCPSGPETPDTFRMYEALEAGCVPIVDGISSRSKKEGYWQMLFGEEVPFPLIKNWKKAKGDIQYHADVYPQTNNRVFAWWQNYKRELAYAMLDDIYSLSKYHLDTAMMNLKDYVTILIPTSPILSHPDTSIIEHTISTVRTHFPNSEIIIMFDGVRPEHEDRRANYEEYIRRMLWKCNYEYENILPLIFNNHTHQAGMTKAALKLVRTPVIGFVEHDTPVTPDLPLDALGIVQAILEEKADMVRFHFESHILDVHKHLMLDENPQIVCGVPMTRTIQWSQRPHLASTAFYKRILEDHFSQNALTMIEDKIHGIVHQAYLQQSLAGWNKYKLWIYTPEGNIKRSYHLDGRQTDSKFDETFIY